MKVLSLLQPWASLVVLGLKKIETRSFQRGYRGPLLIHASKPRARIDLLPAEFAKAYNDAGMWEKELPYGAIIGMVKLKNIFSMDAVFRDPKFDKDRFCKIWGVELTDQELAFGDYSPGRYGYLLSDPVTFDEPIPAKGMLGLWNYDGPLPPEVLILLSKQ